MPLMSTCLSRLGSRYSLMLDPIRRGVQYGSLGMMCQFDGELVIGLKRGRGDMQTLPLCREGEPFLCVEQHLSMTGVRYVAYSVELGVQLTVQLTAPFWPQDEKTSLVPAYLVDITIERSTQLVRWNRPDPKKPATGTLVFGLKLPDVAPRKHTDGLRLDYAVKARDVFGTEGPHVVWRDGHPVDNRRQGSLEGTAGDRIIPIDGDWRVNRGRMQAAFDVSPASGRLRQSFSLAMVSHCGDALFERLGYRMPLKYTKWWPDADAVAAYVKRTHQTLRRKSRAFDGVFSSSSLSQAAQQLSAVAFQSYLMNTLWCVGGKDAMGSPARAGVMPPREWFSVWEGTCWFNSTVDVTYNEAMFYFACWPQLLEMLFEEWSHHVNDLAAETARRERVSDDDQHGNPLTPFPDGGAVLEHDMGAGWSCNGQSYWHAMPVEENSNFLLMLYAHAQWWSRPDLLEQYAQACRRLATYLLWADSTGNGFPDRGCANTIDDANPAVQYGRDNVYLGVKRLAALHAAGRIFEHLGDDRFARACHREVKKAVRTLNAGWRDDHFPVVLDKSARGLIDNVTGKPLPYRTLPGWDAYSLYTTNGLLYLLMIDDLPEGLDVSRLRADLINAERECRTAWGSSHSSADPLRVWVSMNLWRDCIAAYLGEDMQANCERYWHLQQWANGPGGDKANAFTETSMTNNLVTYPRGAACFGLPIALAGLTRNGSEDALVPHRAGHEGWPLLPLADWKRGVVPFSRAVDGEHVVEERGITELALSAAEKRGMRQNYTTTTGD